MPKIEKDPIFLNCYGSEYLNALVEESHMTKEEVYARSGLVPFFPYALSKGRRIPTRDTLIQLAFGLKLHPQELNDTLEFFNYKPLREEIQRESAIITALQREINFAQAQEFLQDRGFSLIGLDY